MAESRPIWARLDCSWRENPKILALAGARGGWQAIVMYLHSITYATHHLTDGFIPLGWPKSNGYAPSSVKLLTAAELWHEVSALDLEGFEDQPLDGWIINDHLAYQKSRAEWAAQSEARRAAALRANAVRWGSNVTPIDRKTDRKTDPTQRNATIHG